MPIRRIPCLIAHEGYPGMKAKFVDPDSNLLEDYELRHIETSEGVIEYVANTLLEAALHFHTITVEE